MTIGGLGAPVLQVVDDRLADDACQRIRRPVTSLALGNIEPLVLPVDVFQRELGNLIATQTVRHEQQKNGVVTPPQCAAPVRAAEHVSDFIPCDGTRHTGQSMYPRHRHRSTEVAGHNFSR